MRASQEDDREPNRISLAQVLGVLGQVFAVGGFCYFILCFALVFALARNLDLSLIFFISFEDYLKAGIHINLFLAVLLALMFLTFRAMYDEFPKHIDEDAVSELSKEYTKRLIVISLWVLLFIATLWNLTKLNYSGSSGVPEPSVSFWPRVLFWTIAALAFLYGVLSLRREYLWPVLAFLFSILANIYAGHFWAENLKLSRANLMVQMFNSGQDPIIGTFVMPVAAGVIYIPSDVCSPSSDKHIRLISWSAVGSLENISRSAGDCAPTPGSPPAR